MVVLLCCPFRSSYFATEFVGLETAAVEVYFMKVFLLRRQEALKKLYDFLGADCCKLLLDLQVPNLVKRLLVFQKMSHESWKMRNWPTNKSWVVLFWQKRFTSLFGRWQPTMPKTLIIDPYLVVVKLANAGHNLSKPPRSPAQLPQQDLKTSNRNSKGITKTNKKLRKRYKQYYKII